MSDMVGWFAVLVVFGLCGLFLGFPVRLVVNRLKHPLRAALYASIGFSIALGVWESLMWLGMKDLFPTAGGVMMEDAIRTLIFILFGFLMPLRRYLSWNQIGACYLVAISCLLLTVLASSLAQWLS